MTSIQGFNSPLHQSPLGKGKEAQGAQKAVPVKAKTAPKVGVGKGPSRGETLFFRKLVETRKLKKMAQRKARKKRRRKKKKKKPEQELSSDALPQ